MSTVIPDNDIKLFACGRPYRDNINSVLKMAAMTSKLNVKSLYKFWSFGARGFASSGNYVDVQVNDRSGTSIVTMQRAPVNAMNLEFVAELKNTFLELEKDRSRGMILTSAYPTVFCAGLDLKEQHKPQPDRFKEFWMNLQDMWLQLYSTSYPTAAVVNGHSPAGGCLLACACEYRIMVDGKFTIGLNETQLGVVAPKWLMEPFKVVLGNRTAEIALTTGKLFPVDEALNVGLIDELAADKSDGIAKAQQFLSRFDRIPSTSRALTKLALRGDIITWLKNNREEDFNDYWQNLTNPHIQDVLDLYIKSLKKK